MKTALVILAALSLSGCLATFDGTMENRVVCTAAKDKAYALSEYGPVSIGARISELDRAVICK
jgi:hypothetical protein